MCCEVEDCNSEVYKSIITEYSAFGHEYMKLCKMHYDEVMEARRNPPNGYCERCGDTDGVAIRPFQDPEEGSSACYLDTCEVCRKNIMESFCE